MNLYLMRVCEADKGSDPGLSEKGKRQASMMAAFMKRQIGRVDIVISGVEAAATETGEIMAAALGSYVATTTLMSTLDVKGTNEEIARLAQRSPDVLVIVQNEALIAPMYGASLNAGSVMMLMEDTLQWLITPALIESTEELIEAARELSESLKSETFTGLFTEAGRPVFVDEKQGEYYYEDVALKRWALGDGGKTGNCDVCEDNADRGWIDADDVFETQDGDVDEPPGHISCDCTLETKDTTKRVYV